MNRITEWRGEHAAIVDNHVNYIDKLAQYEDAEERGEFVRVIHAEWIVYRRSRLPVATCSHCRFSFNDVYDIENYDAFCRHCGAVMDRIKTV